MAQVKCVALHYGDLDPVEDDMPCLGLCLSMMCLGLFGVDGKTHYLPDLFYHSQYLLRYTWTTHHQCYKESQE